MQRKLSDRVAMRRILFTVVFCMAEAGLLEKTFDKFVTAGLSQILPFQNKCIGDLGCFFNGPPFYDALNRPVSLLPTDDLTTRFLFFTHKHRDEPIVLNLTESSVDAAEIYKSLPTKIIIHGYNVGLDKSDIRFQIKEELLRNGTFNVIVVDWTDMNQFPYPQAVANARAVGAQVAKLVKILMKYKGINIEDVHIIGHSLGAHIAGWAGERLKNLGRISGLDPAGVYFQKAPPEVRLDDTDATFVDIIHTNGANIFLIGLGIEEPIGHIDFYPNGGSHQPGCILNHEIEETLFGDDLTKLVANSCDHSRAYLYFKDSINTCMFASVNCSSYANFQDGKCTKSNSDVLLMGYHAIDMKDGDKYYLKTTSSSPFCKVNASYVS